MSSVGEVPDDEQQQSADGREVQQNVQRVRDDAVAPRQKRVRAGKDDLIALRPLRVRYEQVGIHKARIMPIRNNP